jgi:hypothetical protein
VPSFNHFQSEQRRHKPGGNFSQREDSKDSTKKLGVEQVVPLIICQLDYKYLWEEVRTIPCFSYMSTVFDWTNWSKWEKGVKQVVPLIICQLDYKYLWEEVRTIPCFSHMSIVFDWTNWSKWEKGVKQVVPLIICPFDFIRLVQGSENNSLT